MRKLLLILVAVFSVACSSAPKNTATLTVIGVGKTEELARQNGFKQAIELHVGSVILDEKEVRDYKLVKDDILNYSAGYIDHYQVISTSRQGNEYRLEMIVRVSSSKIAERILKQDIQPSKVDGNQMRQTFDSYMRHLKQGDELLLKIMSVFPQRAFNIDMKSIDFKVNRYRDAVIEVPFTVTWNNIFQSALREALDASQDVAEGSDAPYSLRLNMAVTGNKQFSFIDPNKIALLYEYMRPEIDIKFDFYDQSGKSVFVHCERVELQSQYLSGDRVRGRYLITSQPYRRLAEITISQRDSRYQVLSNVSGVRAEAMYSLNCEKSLEINR